MIVLDVSVVITALPKIHSALHFSPTGLSWVQNAYTLTFGGLLLLGARAGDILGRRRMFVAGIALFTRRLAAGGLAPVRRLAAGRARRAGRRRRDRRAVDARAADDDASARAASARARSPTTAPSRAAAAASASCSAACSPTGSRGAGASSSTCPSGSP